MISLRDDFEQEPDEPCVPADDIEFWKDVFSCALAAGGGIERQTD